MRVVNIYRVHWLTRILYSCFNAFSRVDIRVDVKIPGGVNAYAIDLRGERHEATQELWQETYVSALLRSILYSDDPNYWLDAYRKLDPITSPDSEIRFLQAAEALFMKGSLLSSFNARHLIIETNFRLASWF